MTLLAVGFCSAYVRNVKDLQKGRAYIVGNEKDKCACVRTITSQTRTCQRNEDQESGILWPHQKTVVY